MWKVILICNAVTLGVISQKGSQAIVGNPVAFFPPCKGNDAIVILFEQGLPPGEENQYSLHVREKFVPHSKVDIRFDTDATVKLENSSYARIKADYQTKSFEISFFKPADALFLRVKGPPSGEIPYVENIVINTLEYCDEPLKGFLDSYIVGARDTAELLGSLNPEEGCGRRKIHHTELIVSGSPTVLGDWPWHAAIYRFERSRIDYICGGTLVSMYFVLTAAHCVTSRGLAVLPETRNVVLGKYNLVGGDIAAQEKEVHKIIKHEGFDAKTLDKDIALMKLKTAVEFTNYVQPACLWHPDAYKRLPKKQIFGTVVGWGFDHTDSLSLTLQQVLIPKMPESICIKSNPVFFSKKLDGTMFCAGYANGTSVCNGDSGGGYHVFVPDVSGSEAHDTSGSWHVRGIVSVSVKRRDAAICDPESYALFTDVAKYGGWIRKNMKV